ncbi:MAG: N-acetyltransferase [Chitinophagaceae bacterium]|nr:N-acetyltransferase [Chitinophagaceae bacterium]
MITVRPAVESDLPLLLEIYNEVIMNTTAVYDYEPHTMEMRQQWWQAKQSQRFPVFVAEANGLIAGFSSIGPFRAWAAYQYTVENSIYVAASSRGKGIGKVLLPPLINAAKELKMHSIVAGIDASNTASIKLHQSFGFEEVAHFKQVGWKFNQWLDLKFLQRIL